jgi:hypothetical protein
MASTDFGSGRLRQKSGHLFRLERITIPWLALKGVRDSASAVAIWFLAIGI